jgi:hypothetical protein
VKSWGDKTKKPALLSWFLQISGWAVARAFTKAAPFR